MNNLFNMIEEQKKKKNRENYIVQGNLGSNYEEK